jgi:speckle-type POZ protein
MSDHQVATVESQSEELAPPPGMVSNWCVTENELTKVDFEWTIERLAFLKPFENWGRFDSSLFSNGKTQNPEWKLSMDGVDSNRVIRISLDIPSQVKTGSPIRVKVAILNVKREKIFSEEHYFPENTGLPCDLLMIKKTILFESNCFDNGKLNIYCEIENLYPKCIQSGKSSAVAVIDEEPFSNRNHLMSQLEDLFESMKYSDIIINVRGHEYPAHKTILVTRSCYFAAMFEHPTKENLSNQIEIDDMEPDVFHEILRFIYTGRASETAMEKMCLEILAVADKYLLDPLKKECETQLTRRLTTENCLQLLLITDEHHPAFQLKKYAIDFFRRFYGEVMAMDDWEKAKKDHPQTCMRMLEELVKSFV